MYVCGVCVFYVTINQFVIWEVDNDINVIFVF